METLLYESKNSKYYLELLSFFSQGLDNCFFIFELTEGKIYFSKDIHKKYAFLNIKDNKCDISDILVRVYDCETFKAELERITKKQKNVFDLTFRIVDDKDNIIWIHTRGKVQCGENGQPLRVIGQVSEKVQKYKMDLLTGAFSVSQFIDDVNEVCQTGNVTYLLAVDVDSMKHINLKNGREYGNNLLKKVVKEFEKLIKPYDYKIYRINGDCFAAILDDIDKEGIEEIYNNISERFKGICSISAGAVKYGENITKDGNIIYQCLEIALDEAKRQGRNQLRFFHENDYQQKISIVKLQDSMRKSIMRGFDNFCLNYQPQIDPKNHKLYGAEALLRYNDPERGNVPPTEFIPILEETDMICEIGLWVLKNAVKQCKIWREKIPDFHISVNLSYSQLRKPDIAQRVLEILQEEQLSGKALTLEVTESMQLHNYRELNNIFSYWKSYGIEISVDDFGTGYSSLNRLQKLDIDEIKIDRCFITEIQNSFYNYQLVNNVIKLAENSHIRVCCEGIETADELATLQKLGPELLQGYLFGRPYDAGEFEKKYINSDPINSIINENNNSSDKINDDDQSREHQLEKILDSLEDCIYVSDMKTYDVYYMNKAHMQMFGVKDYRDKKCYQLMHKRNDPCEFCKKWDIDQNSSDSWYTYVSSKDFIVKDKIIDWNGKKSRIQIIKSINN